MIRLFVILASLAVLHEVHGSCSTESTTKPIPLPTTPPKTPPCDKILCSDKTDDKISALLQKIADSCFCDKCGNKKKFYIDLFTFCEKYRNYDPVTYAIIECIQNKLSDPCYSYYNDLIKILKENCKGFNSANFNVWTFLYNVCWGCAGCLDWCYVQNGGRSYYAGAPVEVLAAAPKMGAAAHA